MFNYRPLLATANRLIGNFGKPAIISRQGEATGPAWNPQPGLATDRDTLCVELSYSLTNRNESLIQRGDKLLLLRAGVEPAVGNTITVDAITYQVIDVQPLNPGGTVMLYEVQARK
jgi:hypothetical protein